MIQTAVSTHAHSLCGPLFPFLLSEYLKAALVGHRQVCGFCDFVKLHGGRRPVARQYLWGIGSRTFHGTKIHGCSSFLYKMV
jgi:hypothetical protein